MSCPGCRRDRVHLASAEREKGSRSEVRLDRCFGTFVPKGMQSCVLSGLPQGQEMCCGRWPGLFWWSTWPLQLLSSLHCIRRPLRVRGLGRARLRWRARPFPAAQPVQDSLRSLPFSPVGDGGPGFITVVHVRLFTVGLLLLPLFFFLSDTMQLPALCLLVKPTRPHPHQANEAIRGISQ